MAREIRRLPGIELCWLADISLDRLSAAQNRLAVREAVLTTDGELAACDPSVSAVFITVPDYLHRSFATTAFEANKHVFLEKPIATTLADGWSIINAWQRSGRVLQLGYVLRNAPFYREIRRIIRDGHLGRIHTINMVDHLGVVHGASYMRRWHRDSTKSGGLMVHKGCHDLDLICWLLDTTPIRVSSFGGLTTFKRNAPARFCSQCPEEATCLYRDEGAYETRTQQQQDDPARYGLDLCVFADDKDIVDNQVVNFELRNETRGTFTLSMDNPQGSQRRISIFGNRGKLEGNFERNEIELSVDSSTPVTLSTADTAKGGHGGGDRLILRAFLESCLGRRKPELTTEIDAMRSLIFALAAERSRLTGQIVTVSDDLKFLM